MTEDWGNWSQGVQYDVRTDHGNLLWYDQGQYHGRIPVQIKDNVTGEVWSRIGDVRVIGNWSPIWVSFNGLQLQLTEILRLPAPLTRDEVRKHRLKEGFLKRGIENPGPKDWFPPERR